MTSVHGGLRWGMLAVISLGIIALTLNWFDVATAFPLIGAEFRVGLGPLSFLISLYIVGYGLTHIPGGMLATAIGMKKTLVAGLLVQGLAGIMSGLSYSYGKLAFFRVVSGIGGSVFIAVGTAALGVWFREKDVTLALGITGGATFSAGAAFALYVWLYVQRAAGWHLSLVLAGVFELLVMLLMIAAFHLTLTRHLDPSAGGLLSALIGLAGIPGSLLGGYYADRSQNLRLFVVGPLIVVAALLALILVVPTGAPWALGIGIGFFLIFGFAAWLAIPARVCDIKHRYIGDRPDAHAGCRGRLLHPHRLRAPRAPYQFRHRLGLSGHRVPGICPAGAGRAQPGGSACLGWLPNGRAPDDQCRATVTEPRIIRARAPDPESPSRKNATGCRCGRATEKISTPLEKPPCPVTDDRQIRKPRRIRQPANSSPTDVAAYFPLTTVRPGSACSAAAVGNEAGQGRLAGGRVASISSSRPGTSPVPQVAH
jgi:predicted MFS family arabinose efflux permease